ncbi:SWI/SNF complex subunit SWI3D [Phoenix dactylifera]|uniref:SWI/SNF complex subunit SWI3D n=1 Tax=Phoenix dactylifera TaxID=42345 RepID=A0A8B7C2I5_PHODC|nr:SWI/SNF complex subunit SWI3D [Phoenix dactylifera]
MEGKGRDVPPAPANSEAAPAVAVAETLVEGPRRRAGAAKRKASTTSSSSAGPSKRHAKERNPLHHLPPVHNGPCTRARQSPNKVVAAVQRTTETSRLADSGGKGGSAAADPAEAEVEELVEEPLVDVDFDLVRSRGANVHAVPTPAGWFSWKRIHPIENQMLASFFNGKSENRTPEIYMEIRNSIMKKFHADPQTQVELKDFSDLSAGDMDARQEVMEFLDHWGLINFHPFPPSKPDVANSDADSGAKTPSLVDKLYQFETVNSFPRYVPKKAELSVPAATPCLLPESALADDLIRPVGPSVEYHCNSCAADCSRKRYHCQKQADFDLCADCYNDGKFGSGMAPGDFILMDSVEVAGASGGSWTDQETLLLLEALELFGENWNEIAEHVATKTKAQCILHFLQMPIEDSFLEGEDDARNNIQENRDHTSADKELAAVNVPEPMEDENAEAKDSAAVNVPGTAEAENTGAKKESTAAHVSRTTEAENAVVKEESAAIDDLETKEVENAGDADQAITSATNATEKKSTVDVEISYETGVSIALDALKTAFHAVGYFPEEGGLGSFAEAGNPVMALAAFLVGLVEHDVATTSCRSSLKAMSEESPGIQLATRHCFILEDPPNDRKDSPACASVVADMVHEESHKDVSQTPNLEGADKSNDCTDKNEENAVSLENEKNLSIASQDCSQKQPDAKESCDVVFPSEKAPSTIKDSADRASSGEPIMSSAPKDASDSVLPVVSSPNNTKEPGDLASPGEKSPSAEKKIDDLKSSEDKPSIMKETGDVASPDKVEQQSDTLKASDMKAISAGLEEQEPQQTTGNGSAVEIVEKTDESNKKESPSNDEKNCDSTAANDDHNIDRLKRAAVTALSAAAVKARLLAKQEEDHIRQLVSLVIEKQLQKLEAKLTLFADIESVIMRVREQTDRARQRLLHERSQIIAARLGLPTSSFRANPPSLPTSRLAMGYGTAGPRPLNMAAQKPPPMRRP